MAEASSVGRALERLDRALAVLDDAIDRREEAARTHGDLEEELHRLSGDRSRLAQSLDAAEARSARLDQANRDVSRRLVSAMESIRSVLGRHGS